MSEAAKDKTALQWHPAFYAGIQIELAEEAQHLIFENEHQLGTKPKEIDVLIIKKDPKVFIRKNIGRIFRKHNIIEYKCPEDYLSIDDYYKVYGYACFYKSDTKTVNEIRAKEITISFVIKRYPRKVIRHLEKEQNLQVQKQDNNLHQSLMNIIIRANKEVFKEAGTVCEALYELMEEQFKEREEQAQQLGEKRGKEKTLLSLISKKLSKGQSVEQIADALEETVENISKMCEVANKFAPDYDIEKIRKALREQKA